MRPNWKMLREYIRTSRLFSEFEASCSDTRTRQERAEGAGTWKTLIRHKYWSIEGKSQGACVRFRNVDTGRSSLWGEWELYNALSEFLKKKAGIYSGTRSGIGLVLAGGGAKGAYEIGVWKALRELDLESCVKGLSGSSIGAVNSLLFAKGDLEGAMELWRHMSNPWVRAEERLRIEREGMEYTRRLLQGNAAQAELATNMVFLSQPELKQALTRTAGGTGELLQTRYTVFSTVIPAGQVDEKIRGIKLELPEEPPPFTELWEDFPEAQYYLPWGLLSNMEIVDAVLASAAMPVAYAPVKFRGYPYLDGGLYDNLPFYPLYRGGFRNFILVDLRRSPKRIKNWRKEMDGCQIVRIQPREEFQDDILATLNLTPKMTEERMKMGYEDALKQFGWGENLEKLRRMVRDV